MIQRFATGNINAKGTANLLFNQLTVNRPFIMRGLHVGAIAYDTPNTYFLMQEGCWLQINPLNVAVNGGLQDSAPSTEWTAGDWEFNLINLQFGRSSAPFMFDRYINAGAIITIAAIASFDATLITAGDNCDGWFSMWWEEVSNDGTQGVKDLPFKVQEKPYLHGF